MDLLKTNIQMNAKHQSPAQAESIYEVSADCNSITEIADSAEMEFFPLMSLVADDAAMIYIKKGEVTLVYDMKTYILSKGMLLYKAAKATVRLISVSKDCHFFAMPLKLKYR